MDDPHERDPLTFVLYHDKAGEWRWRLKAANNKTIANSGEGYKNYGDALHALELIQDESGNALITYDPPESDPTEYPPRDPPYPEMDDG